MSKLDQLVKQREVFLTILEPAHELHELFRFNPVVAIHLAKLLNISMSLNQRPLSYGTSCFSLGVAAAQDPEFDLTFTANEEETVAMIKELLNSEMHPD